MKYLFNTLYEYTNKNRIAFHMPGHKLGNLCSFSNIHKMDITEIDGFDNLHNPKNIIKNSQIRASKLFNSDETYFIVNGSTTGNISAILSICKDGDKIAIARNSHKSVFSGIILSGADSYYIKPKIIDEINMLGQITPKSIENILKKNNNIKAVFITSPTYEGFTANIKKISTITHKYNALLIVDEAHGAHFNFNDYFPESAINCGADIVIQSIHKTLPSLTQTALLHIKYNNINNEYIEKIKSSLSILQTSSPSYILMASIDNCCEFLEKKSGKYFEKYIKNLEKYRKKFKKFKNLKLIDNKKYNKKFGIYDFDKSKFIFFINSSIMTTKDINNILINKYNIQIEYFNENHIIIMTSIANTNIEFKKLHEALYEIDNIIDFKGYKNSSTNNLNLDTIKLISIRKAYFSEKKEIKINKSLNNICGDFIIPYPPGIPILCPGEKITYKSLNYINKLLKNNINIIGITNNKIKVLKNKEV